MKAIIDTSAIIEYRRGSAKVSQIIDDLDDFCTSSICSYEYLAASKGASQQDQKFLTSLTPMPFTFADSQVAAKISRLLARSGKKVNEPDVLIYTQALRKSLAIVTLDTDFAKINAIIKGNLQILNPDGR